jgi:F-box interacting protein
MLLCFYLVFFRNKTKGNYFSFPQLKPEGMSLSKPCAMPAKHSPILFNLGALPLDVVRMILLHLEAKELCRLRLVCREWRSILSNRYFAATHFALHPPLLIIACYTGHMEHDALADIMDLSGQVVKRVRRMEGYRAETFPLDRVYARRIDDNNIRYRLPLPIHQEFPNLPHILLDPATGVAYHIPYGYAAEHVELWSWLLAKPDYLFGQVPSTGEYKILRKLFHFFPGIGGRQSFEVCTLNSSSGGNSEWRLATSLEENIMCCNFTGVVIDGMVYCLSSRVHRCITSCNHVPEKDLIYTFDLETEVWGLSFRGPPITFPDDADRLFSYLGFPPLKQLTLANLNGALAVVHGPAPRMDFWIMLDVAKGRWEKMYSIQFDHYTIFQHVHPLFVGDQKRILLYKQDHDFLLIYDPRTNTLTNSVESKHFSAVSIYRGNLLSLA